MNVETIKRVATTGLHHLGIHPVPRVRVSLCGDHGEYESRCFMGAIWTGCPRCAEEATARARLDQEALARVLRREMWERRLGEAGIPPRFQDRSLRRFVAHTPQQEKARAFAERYADGFDVIRESGRCALFIGRPGTGKTHLAVGIGLRVMHRDGRTVLFTTVMRALRRVKDTWGSGRKESESQAVAALVFPDLLILDEVGVQFGTETERLILFDILNERYEKRRPTILLSNLTLKEIQQYLGERVFDRLREDGGEVVVFDWESWRGGREHRADEIGGMNSE